MAKGIATIDFGATPVDEKSFTITDATMAGLTYVEPFFMGSDSTADNNADNHKMAGALIRVIGSEPIGNDFNVTCFILRGYVTGQFKLRYAGA